MADESASARAGIFARLRASIAAVAMRRARRLLAARGPKAAIPWLRLAARYAPAYGTAHRALIGAHQDAGDPLGAIAEAEQCTARFPDHPEAWVTLGAMYGAAYRTRDALRAYEEALVIEELAEAAMAAGFLYRRLGDHNTAGARFARAYAAGAGPDALRENAHSLAATGDAEAAREAMAMWERETGLTWEAPGATRKEQGAEG